MDEETPRGKLVSLRPLGFEEAVSDLLKVEPPPKAKKAKKAKRPAQKGSTKRKRGERDVQLSPKVRRT